MVKKRMSPSFWIKNPFRLPAEPYIFGVVTCQLPSKQKIHISQWKTGENHRLKHTYFVDRCDSPHTRGPASSSGVKGSLCRDSLTARVRSRWWWLKGVKREHVSRWMIVLNYYLLRCGLGRGSYTQKSFIFFMLFTHFLVPTVVSLTRQMGFW